MVKVFGITTFILMLFTVSTGLRIIKVPFWIHKILGLLAFAFAVLHVLFVFFF